MNLSRVTVIAATSCVCFWAGKGLVIALSGGVGHSPLESPLFFAGLLTYALTTVLLGLLVSVGRHRAVRAVAVVATPVACVLLAGLVEELLILFRPPDPSWAWGEAIFWIGGLVVLVLALLLGRRADGARPREAWGAAV
jgi:hypothetical protein